MPPDGSRKLCRCGNAARNGERCDKCEEIHRRRELARARLESQEVKVGRPRKLNAAQIAEIDAWWAIRRHDRVLAKRFRVSVGTIRDAACRRLAYRKVPR